MLIITLLVGITLMWLSIDCYEFHVDTTQESEDKFKVVRYFKQKEK